VLRIGDLDDLVDDPDVRVELLVVRRLGCADVCPLGEVHEGDLFVERETPLADVRGAITSGRLRFGLEWYLVYGPTIGPSLHDVIVDVAIDGHGLEGLIGGGVDIDQLISWALPPPIGGYSDAKYEFLRRFSDLSPSPRDPSICDHISAGLELEAVRVFVPFDAP
jgi:hypothetical protein